VTLEPAAAVASLKEAPGTAAALAGCAVIVAVVEGPAAKNSSARPVRTAK
jgi:hypothetical protein